MRRPTGIREVGAVLGLLLAATLSSAEPQRGHHLLGAWQFDPAASRFDGGVPYRSGVARFTATPSCIHVEVDIVEGRGQRLRFEYCDPGDGSFVPVRGNPFYDSQSTRWPDARTAVRTERRGAQITGTTRMSVSADRQSYVATSGRIRPDGVPYTSVIVWRRIEID